MPEAEETTVNHPPVPPHRRPLVIDRGRIEAGDHATAIGSGQPDDLLRQYLRLVRRARRQWRHRNIAVRRADIVTLAGHLGWSDEQVLTELAELAGASTRQRAAMLAVLATGASLITISGPAAADPTPMAPATPFVVTVPLGMYAGTGPATAPIEAAEAPTTPGLKSGPATTARHGASNAAPGIRDDGYTFASPTPAAVDGAEVAVGQPPVPPPGPASAPALDDEGNMVAVGEPPVPPATDDDGNAVAVGQPPVPPVPVVDDAAVDDADDLMGNLQDIEPDDSDDSDDDQDRDHDDDQGDDDQGDDDQGDDDQGDDDQGDDD